MIGRVISASRYLILIAVLGSFVAAASILIYGGIESVELAWQAFSVGGSSKGVKTLSIAFIEIVDLFLLGTAFYIISLGLYELFIDEHLPVPDWLQVHDFDHLKSKLIGVVILVMGVLFLGQLVSWDGQRDLLSFGAAIALVITALTFFQMSKKH